MGSHVAQHLLRRGHRGVVLDELSDAVRMPGQLHDVETELAHASVFWMTSRSEGLPLAAIEAMAVGLPVVATRVPGLDQLFADWPQCLVPLDDHAALAEATVSLLADSTRYAGIAEAMQQTAIERYDLNRMLEEYLEVYTDAR